MANNNYHHGDLKAELIREGLLILDKEGYEGLSLRKVAKACGVSQTAPYRHFKDKNELINAIRVEALRAFNERLERAVNKYPDNPARQLDEMGVAYIQFFVENPEYLRLLFLSKYQNNNGTSIDNNINLSSHELPFHTFYKTVESFHKATNDPTLGLEEITLYCWGLVHGISILIANNDINLETDYLTLIRNIFKVIK